MLEKELQLLFDSITNQDSISKVTKMLQKEIFHNPVMVTNSYFHVIAMASDVEFDDSVWNYAMINRCCSKESIDSFQNDEASQVLFSQNGSFLYNTNLGKDIARILGRIAQGDRVLGYIIIFEVNQPFDENDIARSNLACQSLAVTLSNSSDIESRHEYFYREILKMTPYTRLEIENEIHQFQWDFHPNFKIVCAKFPTQKSFAYAPYICDELNSINDDITAFVSENQIIIVNNFSNETNRDILSPRLSYYHEQYHLLYGVSMTFYNLIQLPVFVKQAKRAYEIGIKVDPQEYVFTYSRYLFYDLLLPYDEDELESLLCKEYTQLSHHDKKYEAELVHTCVTYLLCGCDVNKTSNELHIHRNTCNYRLRQIEKLIGGSIDDIPLLIQIYESYKVHHWMELKEV